MPRNITVTFADGSKHVYRNAPDDATPEQVTQRAQREFNKPVKALDGGRNTAPKPRSMLQNLGDAAVNTIAGGAQSLTAIPDTLQTGGNAIMRFINTATRAPAEAGLRAIGATGAANNVRREREAYDRFHAEQGMRTAGDAIEQWAPTPQDGIGQAVRFGSQIVGGLMIPIGPKRSAAVTIPRTPAQTASRATPPRVIPNAGEVIAEGTKRHVPVMTTDVRPPRTFMGKLGRRTGEIIPIAGTGGNRAAQQTARIEATKEFIADYGVTGMDDIFAGRGSLIDDVAENLSATRGGRIKALTTAKKSVMTRLDNAGSVRTPQAIREIERQIRKLAGINKEAYAPVIKELQDFGLQLTQGKTLNQIEGNRRILGAMFKRAELAALADDGQKAVNAIYGPLRADMGNFIRAKGGDAAFNQWKGANDQLAGMAGELRNNTLKGVLRDADMTPEAVGKLLFSGKRSDVARLYANLDATGQAKGRAALIQRVAEKAGGEDINPDTFARGVKALGGQLGVFFGGKERAELEGFTRLLKATVHAPQAGVMVNTGAQNLPAALSVALTQALGLIGGVITGGGIGIAARVYESPAVRNALVALGKAKAGTPAAAQATQRAAMAMIAAQRAMGASVVVGREANDLLTTTVPRAVSAGETPEDPERQQAIPQP